MASLIFIFLLFSNGFFISALGSAETVRFELIHRHSSRQLSEATTQQERTNELVHLDNQRVKRIAKHIAKKRKKKPKRAISIIKQEAPGASIPLNSGAYAQCGQYFVSLHLGTPPQQVLLITDTGSDLLWVNCSYKCADCGKKVFYADNSSSFHPTPCDSQICDMLPFAFNCSQPMSPCEYSYEYMDGTKARGIYARDAVTVNLANGRNVVLEDFLIGCTSEIEGSVQSGGVLGLGYGNTSFIMQSKDVFGGVFSYCLVDHLSPKDKSSFLALGHTSLRDLRSGNMRVTELILEGKHEGFYMVAVDGISLGGEMLDIPQDIWDVKGEGGMLVDSGSSLTFLAEPAYRAVMDALIPHLANVTKVEESPFEFCFNSVGFNESMVPKLKFHFVDGARFEPYVKSYVIDNAVDVKCIGLQSSHWPGVSILGNIMQQNYVWEYDTINKNLGFARSTCVG